MAAKKKLTTKVTRIKMASGDPEWWGTGGQSGSRGGSRPIRSGGNGGVGSFFGERLLDPAWSKPVPKTRIDPTTGKPLFPPKGGVVKPFPTPPMSGGPKVTPVAPPKRVGKFGSGGGLRIGLRRGIGER